MKKIFCYLITVFCALNGFSQFSLPTKAEAADCMNRILLVELKTEDPKHIAKLSKKGNQKEIAEYKNFIKEYNSRVKLYVPKYWTLNKSILFKTAAEITTLIEAGKDKYVVLSSAWREEARPDMNAIYLYSCYTVSLYKSEDAGKRDNEKIDKYNKGQAQVRRGDFLFKVSLRYDDLNEADYRMILNEFNHHIQYASKNGPESSFMGTLHFPEISTSSFEQAQKATLIIPKELLADGLTPEMIKEAYTFPFKICSLQAIDSMILNGEKNVLYFQRVFSEVYRYLTYAIINDETGECLAEVSGESGQITLVTGPAQFARKWNNSGEIGSAHLKAINKFLQNKIKPKPGVMGLLQSL